MGQQKRNRVAEPALFGFLVDSGKTIECAFEGTEQRLQERAFAAIDLREIAAERAREQADKGGEKRDLQPAECCHEVTSLFVAGTSSRAQKSA
jgi:hypothetical protein